MAGYSGTPLSKKLGLKDGQRALLVGVPQSVSDVARFRGFSQRQELGVPRARLPKGPFDYIHVFTAELDALSRSLPALRKVLSPDGMIWISWPKRASKVPTDIDENKVRELALVSKLVDVKVCAVDDVWSGLKLVIPVALRKDLRGPGASGVQLRAREVSSRRQTRC